MMGAVFDQVSARVDRLLSNRRFVTPMVVVTFGAGLYWQLTSLINHDTAWYLHATGKFLDGARLYVDIVEVNPPLAFYLTVPGVLLSRTTGLFIVDGFVIYVFGLIAISLLLAMFLLRREPGMPPSLRRAILLVALIGFAIYPTRDFGQREHLMLVLAFPYVILIVLRARGASVTVPLAACIGILAALGLALKPHFLLVPIVLECYLWWRTRRFGALVRPETVSLAAAILIYLGAIAVVTPEYFRTVVPNALSVYNDAYRSTLPFVLQKRESVLLPMILALQLATRRHQPFRELTDVLCLAATVYFLIYLVQMKGWSYQLYPSSTLWVIAMFVFLPGVLAAAQPAARDSRVRRLAVGVTILVAATAAWIVGGAIQRGGYQNAFMNVMLPLIEAHARESSIFVFSAHVVAPFPLVVYGRVDWASRFPALWLVPGLAQQQQAAADGDVPNDSERLTELRRYVIDSVVEDLAKFRPALVVVDERAEKPYFDGAPFDYIRFFGTDPRFDDIWSPYERIAEWQGFGVYVDRRRQ